MVLGDLFKSCMKESPSAEAIVFKDRRITYKTYDYESDRVAMALLNLGVKKSDRIGIYIPNWPEFLFTYMGAGKIGAVAVPVSWRFSPQEIKFVLEDSSVSVLVMASGFSGMDFVRNIESIRNELPSLKHIVMLEGGELKDWMIPYSKFITEPDAQLDAAKDAVVPDDLALFLYTSGTTGVPKAAMLTHKNLVSYSNAAIETMGLRGEYPLLLDIPLNHVGGAVMGVATCLNAGAKLVMVDTFDPEETLKIIQEERIAIIGQVPAQYTLQLLGPNVEKYDLSSVKIAIVSSQPCPTQLILEIKKRMGVLPLNAYGLTEVSGAITMTKPEDGEEKLKYTVGAPIAGVEVAIMDLDKNILAQGQIGEIVVKGDPVMKGYWKRPDESAKVFDERGYLHTGDMGKLDEDGYLLIVGRKKEMFIRGGENVYPPEVENAIAKHPEVLMVAVVGRPDPVMGEVGRAYVIPRPGTNPTPEGIKEFLKDKLARYKIPQDIIFRDQLPFTPLGKVKKLDLYNEVAVEFKGKN